MTKTLIVSETTSAPKASAADKGLFEIKIIQAGQGSSAFYPSEVLERDGAMAFPAGTHSYWNHPTWSESFERPERNVKDIVGVLEGEPTFKDDALWGKLRVLPEHVETVKALGPHIGMSINASALVEEGEDADGGVRVASFIESPFNSVDVVTHAGAGGAIMGLIESARRDNPSQPGRGEVKESKMSDTNGDLVAAVTGLTALLTEDRAERAAVAEAARKAEEDKNKVDPAVLAVALATKLAESDLAPVQYARVSEAVLGGKPIDDAISAEVAYAKSIREAAPAPIGQVVTGTTAGTKDFDLSNVDINKMIESMGNRAVGR